MVSVAISSANGRCIPVDPDPVIIVDARRLVQASHASPSSTASSDNSISGGRDNKEVISMGRANSSPRQDLGGPSSIHLSPSTSPRV